MAIDLGDVATWTGALVALGAAITAAAQNRRARRSAAEAQESANVATERAAAAAEQAAAAQHRLAEIASRQAATPPWKLAWAAGDTYEAINDGPADVFDVTVKGRPLDNTYGTVHEDHITARSSVEFMAFPDASGDRTITILWRDNPEAEPRKQTRPLPKNPER